jgi:hypothetical protein
VRIIKWREQGESATAKQCGQTHDKGPDRKGGSQFSNKWLAEFLRAAPAEQLTHVNASPGPAGEVTLRNHRLMTFRTLANWPPIWLRRRRTDGDETQSCSRPIRAEIGILKEVFLSMISRPPRIFLTVTHDGSEYLGSLLFDDRVSCRTIYEFLEKYRGKKIVEIGDADASHLD